MVNAKMSDVTRLFEGDCNFSFVLRIMHVNINRSRVQVWRLFPEALLSSFTTVPHNYLLL